MFQLKMMYWLILPIQMQFLHGQKHLIKKAVKLGLYVNYPDSLQFEPTREITRAETAVLLAKLSKMLNVVKEEYVSPEKLLEKST